MVDNYDKQEKYCNLHGWYRKDGAEFKTEMINDDYDTMFFPEDMLGDFMKKCSRWIHEDGEPEQVYECVEEVIEWIEDGEPEITFKKFAKSKQSEGGVE